MGSYGRNFEFRTPPVGRERGGRYYLDSETAIPIGSPVVVADGATADESLTQALPATLATCFQAVPDIGGIAVYEHAPTVPAFAGTDPALTTASDLDTIPVGGPLSSMFQIVRGKGIKVVFRNTEDREFLGVRSYAGRTMVAGLGGATSSVRVGDYLTPGVGDDDNGYWTETTVQANGWLVVETVDHDRGEVEARMTF